MNWLAMGVWLLFVYAVLWTVDAIEYYTWTHREYHKVQRIRVYIGAAVLLIASTIVAGLL